MVESGGGSGADSGPGSKPASSFESAGGRIRFTVELRPGETTIVSWKKLLKEATSSKLSSPGPSVPCASSEAIQKPVSQPSPPAGSSLEPPEETEAKDLQADAGSNRLTSVIEKIERMYAGNGSSEEEDVFLDDVPDDDEYDTEDSFIDDTELDDYFQVDNSTLKHDGFFINRGKLEHIEPTTSIILQPKKRRRKDVATAHSENDDGHNTNKHVKIRNKSRKPSSSIERNSTNQWHVVHDVHNPNVLVETYVNNAVDASLKKKTADKITMGPSLLSKGDGTRHEKVIDQQRAGVLALNNQKNKLKESTETKDLLTQRSNDKSAYLGRSHSGNQLNNALDLDQTIQQKGKCVLVEEFDLNIPPSKDSLQITKVPRIPRREGSNIRPKSSMLDKAIRELEKIVSESRPPSTDVQDPDNSSQAVKRRLSHDIKQKLARVARLAQSIYGKIPKEVINRLMSILGHLMQLRTLKRNLKVMATMGLSAKQEKDDQLRKIKQEVAEMVRHRIPSMNSKAELCNSSNDFQEASPEDEEALKRKCSLDVSLENKICDLYNLYVERLEEDSGPPVRRLYAELAALWPSGVMDANGIKRAISNAKDRNRLLNNQRKYQEKIKKAALAPKSENAFKGEPINVTKGSHVHEKKSDSRDHGPPTTSNLVLVAEASEAAASPPVASANFSNLDKPKQERVKASSSSNPVDASPVDGLPQKKVKRKANMEAVEAQFCLEKVVSQAEEKQKHHMHPSVPLPKPNLLPAAPSGSENLG